ncbi:unnamed protein product [Rotaria sp. Silwood2]|nr:unnamed protein product [Rotaria sp. Silwood2]CAF2730843.1 unnamed protein product [Rotaria sp. Silwood2]CAF2971587.1 unnamed protein product [Rotaria sp. Silwood2]CAF3143538.1 unnamed protein product [Rotaria sp. Silwood2]CAF3857752.1 unnamed protein product [Rotaria sp. Silwood2]
MLLDTHKISLIYDFWKLNNEENYLHDVTELLRKLTESDTIDAEYIRDWVPDLVRLVELWEKQSLTELDKFYADLLTDNSFSDKVDALLRFLYDIQSYEMVKYLLEKNVEHYKKDKIVSSTMSAFHESCIYGFSQVCLLFIRNNQDVNESFSLIYQNFKTNKKETVRNLTGLQLVCLWSKYFPKRLVSYAHTARILLNNGAQVNMTSTESTTPLHWACRARHTIQIAQDLIEHGACISAHDQLNIQPIHYACWARNQSLIELLLSKGAKLTDEDNFGRTPIHFICMPTYVEAINTDDQQQQCDLMKFILNKYEKNSHLIDLKKEDSQGHTLIAYACVSQNLPLLEILLEKQTELLNKTTIDGRTPLMIAIDECFVNGIEYLLKQPGVERNVCDITGNTAIHHACMCTNTSMRESLLHLLMDNTNGTFDLEKRNEQLIDPFMLCTVNQSIDLCRVLIEKNVSLTKKDLYSRQPIHVACQMGNYDLVSLLINSPNVNINAVDDNNRNCLFYAISYGDEKIVDLLLENNITIKIRDRVGDTPLHSAVQHKTNAFKLTNSLLTKQDGKDLINEPAADGMRPLLLAAEYKQPEVIYLLIKNGANVKAVDGEHQTALHIACRSDCMKCAFYLIEFGGLNVNELNCYRQTPIFHAFAANDFDLVQYLVSCGAQIDVRDNQNYLPLHMGIIICENEEYNLNLIDLYKNKHEKLLDDHNNECHMTPLILACMQGKFNVVKHLILNYKVNVLAKCSNGHTPLHYACLLKTQKSLEIVQFLMDHGCTYDKVDQPKGTFLFTVAQHGDRAAAMFFINYWLKQSPNINEVHYCATILDLLFDRANIQHHDIDTKHLRGLIEKGACLFTSKLPTFPCPLINDCPAFYLILLEYNCVSIVDKHKFIFQILHSVATHPHNFLLLNSKDKEFITVCEYFFKIAQLAHYNYNIEHFYSLVDKYCFPQLNAEQPSEQVEILRKQLDSLRSTPLKLSEIARKLIRIKVDLPTKEKFQQMDLTRYLTEFLSQSTF